MKYQLVIQWPASSIDDYDDMVEIEDALIENLSPVHDVDGHDAGSGQVNIFIKTDNPESAFLEVRNILDDAVWSDARVAYRENAKSTYTVLWPKELTDFRVG